MNANKFQIRVALKVTLIFCRNTIPTNREDSLLCLHKDLERSGSYVKEY